MIPKRQKPDINFPAEPLFSATNFNICTLPGIKKICQIINGFGNGHEPLFDIDGDGFSTDPTFRGSDWRGKDCDPNRADIYPGAMVVDEDRTRDSNCNGVYGVDPHTGTPYESLYCSTPELGIAVLGDSASAHFHLPPSYVTASGIDNHTYRNIMTVLENEFDWPMFSSTTGYLTNGSMFHGDITPAMTTNSTYLTMRSRNRYSFELTVTPPLEVDRSI